MSEGRVEDPDREDPTTDPVVRRLTRVKNIITRANERLDRIAGVAVNPSDPDIPDIRTALEDIKTQANLAVAKCDGIGGSLPR